MIRYMGVAVRPAASAAPAARSGRAGRAGLVAMLLCKVRDGSIQRGQFPLAGLVALVALVERAVRSELCKHLQNIACVR